MKPNLKIVPWAGKRRCTQCYYSQKSSYHAVISSRSHDEGFECTKPVSYNDAKHHHCGIKDIIYIETPRHAPPVPDSK